MTTLARPFVGAAAAFLLAAVAGCSPEVKRLPYRTAEALGADASLVALEQAADELKVKLGNYRFPERVLARCEDGRPAVRVLSLHNETDDHLDVGAGMERLREAIIDSGKATVTADEGWMYEMDEARRYEVASGDVNARERVQCGRSRADYVLVGRVANLRKLEGDEIENTLVVTLELHDARTHEAVLVARKELRVTKS